MVNLYTTQSMEECLFQKLTVPQPVKKFPLFYATQSFIKAFTTTRHFYLSWARQIQSMSSLMSWNSILILPFLVRLGFPVVSFPQVTLPKTCMRLSCTSYGLRDEFVHLTLSSSLKGTRCRGTANTNWIALCDYFNVNGQNHSNVSFAVFRGVPVLTNINLVHTLTCYHFHVRFSNIIQFSPVSK
jgi:hypothetical protein